MKRTNLGEFEEFVLLVIGALGSEAYGVSIKNEIKKRTGRNPSVGALHSALYRLEDKRMVESRVGGATAERGGRRKKYYSLTEVGKKALVAANDIRSELFNMIPGLAIKPNK